MSFVFPQVPAGLAKARASGHRDELQTFVKVVPAYESESASLIVFSAFGSMVKRRTLLLSTLKCSVKLGMISPTTIWRKR